ncbi:MAG: Gfo/Idh/MocA family oxidoreductase [Verrucomicrobiae bacterium]|nr:Gfo/Idh/MocA family oxidoreductase [Verrucomicrobiae bacterium]
MSFKCAVVGCGGRSGGHADAYRLIKRGKLVACCDLNKKLMDQFAERYQIPGRYTDMMEMIQKERPDVLHIVTPPTVRVGLMRRAMDAGVPGAIVEKPICVGGKDYKELVALEKKSKTKFVVNHQLRHQPRIVEFLDDVAQGKIGQVRFIDASAVFPMAGQGVHVLDLMFAFAGYNPVATVFGASSGYDDIDGHHPTSKTAECLITFANGIRAALQAGKGAPMVDPSAPGWGHKRVAVYGTNGFRYWWMQGWEKSAPSGGTERGVTDYAAVDVQAQAGLTNAMFDWLEDDKKVSPTNLKTSLDQWLVILAGYLSTIESRPVDMPFDPADDLLDQFVKHVRS